jgi:hypothetical protein
MMGELKAGVSFQERVSLDNDVLMCEAQILEQMMDEKFTSDVHAEEAGRRRMVEKVNFQQHLNQH